MAGRLQNGLQDSAASLAARCYLASAVRYNVSSTCVKKSMRRPWFFNLILETKLTEQEKQDLVMFMRCL